VKPLRVECHLQGSVVRPPMLDSLLVALTAMRDEIPPVDCQPERMPIRIDIPIQVEPGGRFHLCTEPQFVPVGAETHYKNRRFPVEQAAKLGDEKRVNRINISAGDEKSYRIPHSVGFIEGSTITWWCVGDKNKIEQLLRYCRYVGKFRGVGKGKVRAWVVTECEPWEGFPVVREGRPLRPLPLDWPGLTDYDEEERVLGSIGTCYWDYTAREVCAVP
jgi:hypothetical protein